MDKITTNGIAVNSTQGRFTFDDLGNVIYTKSDSHTAQKPNITLIAAFDKKGGIGYQNTMPWHLSEDLQHFKRLTQGTVVIMGRKTFKSFNWPGGYLRNRINIILTRDPDSLTHPMVLPSESLEDAISMAGNRQIFIIGGELTYEYALRHKLCNDMILTEIDAEFVCDRHFPKFNVEEFDAPLVREHTSSNGLKFSFKYYNRKQLVTKEDRCDQMSQQSLLVSI